jgi:hypothetical protein
LGVENWDALMTDFMDFDLEPGGCYAAGEVHLGWELGDECPPFLYEEPVACAVPMSWEDHGTWWEMRKVYIFFNHDWYYNLGPWQELWQVAVSAHEWGHVLNLDDYWWADQCTLNLLMGTADISKAPCLMGPTAAEVDTVIMNYGLLDSDGDGFTDAVEWYLGTNSLDNCACGPGPGGDPWPPDIDMSRDISVTGDVFQYVGKIGCQVATNPECQRLDLDVSGDISITGDVFLVSSMIGQTCY